MTFRWVAPLLGWRGMIRWPRGEREGFITCLKDLYRLLRGYTIWLYVDRARWHKRDEIDLFVRALYATSSEVLAELSAGVEYSKTDLTSGSV